MVIPTIPPRNHMLAHAVRSAAAQTHPPVAIAVATDTTHVGAAATRNRALAMADTEWVAFLDDDDTLNPEHLAVCLAIAAAEDADVVYPWFTVDGGTDPLAVPVDGELVNPFGVPFGAEQQRYLMEVGNFIPVTTLVRRDLAVAIGGFPQPGTAKWSHPECEDWGFMQQLVASGAKVVHAAERTWVWSHGHANTSGRGDRW